MIFTNSDGGARGNPDEVGKMIELCKKRPKHAQIMNVEIKEDKFQGFKGFKVLHF